MRLRARATAVLGVVLLLLLGLLGMHTLSVSAQGHQLPDLASVAESAPPSDPESLHPSVHASALTGTEASRESSRIIGDDVAAEAAHPAGTAAPAAPSDSEVLVLCALAVAIGVLVLLRPRRARASSPLGAERAPHPAPLMHDRRPPAPSLRALSISRT